MCRTKESNVMYKAKETIYKERALIINIIVGLLGIEDISLYHMKA